MKKTELRQLVVNDGLNKSKENKFISNYIKTTRYTLLSFLPMCLLHQYQKMANLYFLLLSALSLIDGISPWTPASQIVPTGLVLLISLVREGCEDLLRFRNDKKINNQYFEKISPDTGKTEKIRSSDIKVGDILVIHDEQEFPSDLILIDSSSKGDGQWSQSSMASLEGSMEPREERKEEKSVLNIQRQETFGKQNSISAHCFIETTSLDGEKNLKKKVSPKDLNIQYGSSSLKDFRAVCKCDAPNSDLYQFKGTLNTDMNNYKNKTSKQEVYRLESDTPLRGNINSKKETTAFSLTEHQILLKGAKLLNTKWVVGFVVYTGKDTKLMQNQDKVRFKQSKQEKEMNRTVVRLFIFHVLVCIVLTLASYSFNNQKGWKPYLNEPEPRDEENIDEANAIPDEIEHLEEAQDEVKTASQSATTTFFTYLLLNSTYIPVSLMVTIEFAKTVQGYFMQQDAEMCSESRDYGCRVNTCSLTEELGQVSYVFSDKTGTLTRNLMEFKICKIGHQIYGDQKLIKFSKEEDEYNNSQNDINDSFCSENKKQGTCYNYRNKFLEEILFTYDGYDTTRCDIVIPAISGAVKFAIDNQKMLIQEFLKALSLAHQCMPVEVTDKDGIKSYSFQGPSPDEVALVEMAQQHGYEFIYGSESNRKIRRKIRDPITKEWQILETSDFRIHRVIEFSSDRKRMSILIQDPTDGYYKLYCKGADSAIKERLNMDLTNEEEVRQTDSFLRRAALQGLRTLLVAMKILDSHEVKELQCKFMAAEQDLQNRQERLEQIHDELERDLCLIGATVVEDRLQDEVQETIEALHQANIKVWMLTGDKFETAESIGYSSKLLVPGMDILRCATVADAESLFNEDQATLNETLVMQGNKRAMVIEASALQYVLEDKLFTYKRWFLKISRTLETVICCRVSPSQKAEVVRIIRDDDPEIVTLAIGDGANDVSMILEADIGIGVFGNEGMQAVDNSDFAIAEFQYLWHLLFKHGRWNYMRMSELIAYFFYKNYVYTGMQVLFSAYNGFSGSTIFPDWFLSLYNTILTAAPIAVKSMMDQDVYPIQEMDGEQFRTLIPQLYYSGQRSLSYNQMIFYWWTFIGSVHVAIIFFIPYQVFKEGIMEEAGYSNDMWTFSMAVFTPTLFVVTNKFLFIARKFNWALVIAIAVLSYGFYFWYIWVTDSRPDLVRQHYTFYRTWSSGSFYLTALLPIGLCFYIDFLISSIKVCILTDPMSLIRTHLYENSYKDVALTQEFLDRFNYFSNIQQRLGVLEDYFREEELERIRAYKAELALQEQNEEEEIAETGQRKATSSKKKKAVLKENKESKFAITESMKKFLKKEEGPEQPGNFVSRFINNIKSHPSNFQQTLHRVGGVERKMPTSRQTNRSQTTEPNAGHSRGTAAHADIERSLQINSLRSAPADMPMSRQQRLQKRTLRVNDIELGGLNDFSFHNNNQQRGYLYGNMLSPRGTQSIISKKAQIISKSPLPSNIDPPEGAEPSAIHIRKSENVATDRQKFKHEIMQMGFKPSGQRKYRAASDSLDAVCEASGDDRITGKRASAQTLSKDRIIQKNQTQTKSNCKTQPENILAVDVDFGRQISRPKVGRDPVIQKQLSSIDEIGEEGDIENAGAVKNVENDMNSANNQE